MGQRVNTPRFPAAQLLTLWPPETSARTIAEACGVERGAVQRWRAGKTTLDEYRADEIACRLGLHPKEIWSNWA